MQGETGRGGEIGGVVGGAREGDVVIVWGHHVHDGIETQGWKAGMGTAGEGGTGPKIRDRSREGGGS